MTPLQRLALLALPPALSGCELIGDIFKAGVWTGVVVVVAVIVAIVYAVIKLFR